ncbi:MAG: hypothetical protein AB7G13_18555 [Lautropia sp.]
MRIDAHLHKWRRFDAVRQRLHPLREFELWYWATLSGGTALVNAALHAAGVTEENRLFATQVPDVYAVYDSGRDWHAVLGRRCDLIHVGLPEIGAPLPEALQRAFDAMHRIEHYRDPCVRGSLPMTEGVVEECETAYRALTSALGDLTRCERP